MTGLGCNQRGSVQAVDIELAGGVNVLVSDTMSNGSEPLAERQRPLRIVIPAMTPANGCDS